MIDDYDYDMDDEMIERKRGKKTTVATMTWFPLLSAIPQWIMKPLSWGTL